MLTPGGLLCALLSGAGVQLGACEAPASQAPEAVEVGEAAPAAAPDDPVVQKEGLPKGALPPARTEDGLVKPAQMRKPGDVPASEVDYIAKVKDAKLQANVLDVYRKDPDAARKAFGEWAGRNGLEGFELVQATYSGEVIFRLSEGAPEDVRKALGAQSARAFASEWGAREGVVYCDPDYTARAKGMAKGG